MKHRLPRSMKFATENNVNDLLFYMLYSNSDIFARVSGKDGWLHPSHVVRIDLANTAAKWEEDNHTISNQQKADALNQWKERNLNRQGHMLINNSFSKWKSAQKAKTQKIAIAQSLHQQLAILKQLHGYDSYTEVIEHYLPDAIEMKTLQQQSLLALTDESS